MASKSETTEDNFDVESPAQSPDEVTEPETPDKIDRRSQVVLHVEEPFYATSFQVESEKAGTLVIDRTGTVVPKTEADDITALAAQHGILITEVSTSA